jgi:hypothetical protein
LYAPGRLGGCPLRHCAPLSQGDQLTVFGPPIPLPTPSALEREGWSAEKQAFFHDANAVCAEMRMRMRDPERFTSALADCFKEVAELDPPSREEKEVDAVLRPFRNLVRAAGAVTDEEGEDAFPAAVTVGEFAKRSTWRRADTASTPAQHSASG